MRALVIAISVLVAGCVTNSSPPPNTASGNPEVHIRAPVGTIKALIIARAANHGLNVTKDSDYVLQVEKRSDNIAAAVFLGSRYDGVPNERYVFTFVPLDGQVRVIATMTFVTNPGSAFERATPITHGEGVARTQATMMEIKQQAEERAIAAEAPQTKKKR